MDFVLSSNLLSFCGRAAWLFRFLFRSTSLESGRYDYDIAILRKFKTICIKARAFLGFSRGRRTVFEIISTRSPGRLAMWAT